MDNSLRYHGNDPSDQWEFWFEISAPSNNCEIVLLVKFPLAKILFYWRTRQNAVHERLEWYSGLKAFHDLDFSYGEGSDGTDTIILGVSFFMNNNRESRAW